MTLRNCPDCGELFDSRPTGRMTGSPRRRCEPCAALFRTARAAARVMQKRAIKAGDLDAELIFHADVYTRDNWVCHICGSEVPESSRQHSRLVFGEYDPLAPTVDHIVALAVGGKHTMSNVATAHHKCNQSKGSKETAGRLPGKPARGVKQAPVPFRTCTLHGCGQQHRRRGLCSSHAYREDRYGHPLAASCVCGCGEAMTVAVDHFGVVALPGHGGKSRGGALTVAEQLAQKVRLQPVSDHGISVGLTDDCHIWTGSSNKRGYGMLSDYYTGRKGVAHRFAYILAHGEESVAEKVVDHLCRVPACVNPNHLEAVTNQENALRGHAARGKAPDWHERRLGHPFNPDPSHIDGRGRRCLTCREGRRA